MSENTTSSEYTMGTISLGLFKETNMELKKIFYGFVKIKKMAIKPKLIYQYCLIFSKIN